MWKNKVDIEGAATGETELRKALWNFDNPYMGDVRAKYLAEGNKFTPDVISSINDAAKKFSNEQQISKSKTADIRNVEAVTTFQNQAI